VIFRRLLLALMAAATFATAAAVCVVALAFALYALVEPRLGRAGAAGVVAATTAALTILAGLLMAWAAHRRRLRAPSTRVGGLVERALAFLQQRPIVSASAAAAAGLMAARNPRYLGEALRAFFEGKPGSR